MIPTGVGWGQGQGCVSGSVKFIPPNTANHLLINLALCIEALTLQKMTGFPQTKVCFLVKKKTDRCFSLPDVQGLFHILGVAYCQSTGFLKAFLCMVTF